MHRSTENPFTSHPHSVGESYGEHFLVAMRYAGRLFKASCAAFLHAFAPFLCVTTASQEVCAMYDEMTHRFHQSQESAPASGVSR